VSAETFRTPGGLRRRAQKLAINKLRDRGPVDEELVDRFLARHRVPIIEGERATFLYRGDADEVWVRHRVVGLPDPLPLRRIGSSSLWAATCDLPTGSRVEYQLETRRGDHYERFNDPLNPRLAASPLGSSSVCAAIGYAVPEWVHHDSEAREGELVSEVVRSKALRRDQEVLLYLPARFNRAARYPLLIVHDGTDYLGYTAMKTVLDNLIHRLDIAPMIVAFVPPRDRLKEYPNHAPHARFIARELLPLLTERFPLQDKPLRSHAHGIQLRRHRGPFDGGPLPRGLRLPLPPVGLTGVHRHRHRSRRWSCLRPGREVHEQVPRQADRPCGAHLHDLRDV
jgi:hypothetical protein